MPRPHCLLLLLLLWSFLLAPPCIIVAYGGNGNQSTSLRRPQRERLTSSPTTATTTLEIDPPNKEENDKVVLLNDLSLEQAYLHRAAEGRLEAVGAGGKAFTASLAQQAARLAAGAYDSDVGGARGWAVRNVYKNLNSVAVIATREAGRGCALAFRGSDDRLDWRNDYRARPLPLVLCSTSSKPDKVADEEERQFFLDGRMGSEMGDLERSGLRLCERWLGLYTLHYGFYDSFRLLSHGTTLEEDWRALVRNRTCDASVALITGHSLGGAFVTFAKILGWPGIPVTFAAPRAVANGSCPRPRAADAYPITRIYLTDDPVPATLPMSDSLRVPGVGEPWAHCGCALALQAYYKQPSETPTDHTAADDDEETFAAVAMGCGSNSPLRAREGPAALLLPFKPAGNTDTNTAKLDLLPPLPPLPTLPPPPPPTMKNKNTQSGIHRHIHTRYVRAMDEACQGPLDSPRCLFDHEVA